MKKSRDAFRTISEVSERLDTPAHVLRFWETKFSQIKPVKRAGGRRYYRPQDMDLLAGIKKLLHGDGLSIKAVQGLIKEKGVKHVAGIGAMLDVPANDVEPAKAQETTATAMTDDPDAPAAVADLFGFVPEETNVVALPTAKPRAKDKPQAKPEKSAPLIDAIAPKPKLIGTLARTDQTELTKRAPKIAPIAAKLAALHERMVRD